MAYYWPDIVATTAHISLQCARKNALKAEFPLLQRFRFYASLTWLLAPNAFGRCREKPNHFLRLQGRQGITPHHFSDQSLEISCTGHSLSPVARV